MDPEFGQADIRPFYGERYGVILPLNRGVGGFVGRYNAVVLTFVLTLIFLHFPDYAYTLNSALFPKYIYFAFAALLIPLIALKPHAFAGYLKSPFALWIMAFLLLNLMHLLSASASDGNAHRAIVIETRLKTVLMALLLGFALSIARKASYERIFPVIAALIPCTVLLDFLYPGLLYPVGTEGAVLGRAAGTFINPNSAAEATLLTFLFSCAVLKRGYRTLLFLLAGAGIMLTFGRSAIIAWALLYLLLTAKRILPRSGIFIALIAMVAFTLWFGAFESYLGNRQDLDGGLANIEARLNFFSDMKLDDDSSEERASVIAAGWELFQENPILGAGAGATQVWSHRGSTHNELLLLAAEYGIPGIILWVSMAVLLVRGRYFPDKSLQLAMAFLFVYFSMFTHNLFDFPYWIVTFALVVDRRRSAVKILLGGIYLKQVPPPAGRTSISKFSEI